MDNIPFSFSEWQLFWGTPRAFFVQSEGRKLEIAFLLAIILHAAPFSLIWHKQATKKIADSITLQNVEFIEPEPEVPPPPVQVQKPKSALDFLKMALPIFRKPAAIPEIPREIVPLPKTQEPKLAEPQKLIEKKMPALVNAPEIRMDQKNSLAPKAAEIEKLPQIQKRGIEPVSRDPALKLEEVGKKAVFVPQAPAISLERAPREKAVEYAALPKTQLTPQIAQPQEKLADRSYSAPASRAPSLPLGYEKRGSGVNLAQPREVVRAVPKVQIETSVSKAKETAAGLQISKNKMEITGPLKARKVLKYSAPNYPAWAKAQNIEADSAIRFTVSPAGEVVSMVVERTSGYPALDKSAMEELKKWKFSVIDSKTGDQWGVITFRFLLE